MAAPVSTAASNYEDVPIATGVMPVAISGAL
jgi:hypothetical protein